MIHGWHDSYKWGICVRPGMEPDQAAVLAVSLIAMMALAAWRK